MHEEPYPIDRPALYVVATPIGNLRDLTPRAQAILAGADLIAAEDTRVTGQLLKHFGIDTRMMSLREHNEREAAEKLIARLAEGQAVAQVSDAGTPAVSDPGARLVAAVHAAGYKVVPIPGASALLAALAGAGMQSPRFQFHGFPEPKSGARRKEFETLKALPHTIAFFEAPHRIAESLVDMAEVFGPDRVAVVCRELTKTFETLRRAPLAELASWVAADSNQQRGELVVLVEAAPEQAADDAASFDSVLAPLVRELPMKQAVKLAAEITGGNRNALYERALQLKGD
ncbi:ribosomal RNA small subunit methyltransferase I [Chitinimonas prasina]|uniref:Ribosomal RNA small subunit methyltransferase I n=1 Tax=Chitinimonas prasina TaxID=1434937 RepID=A0ABQ5YIX6_9NEIS|nr:16S rRNA (cytidine(1402)-2'-O)-methyltransferase [Chitinimonas prasina]GLR13300.1 ribosomal RNA small subunit methyltransferase I [Chitinimonas prasina]